MNVVDVIPTDPGAACSDRRPGLEPLPGYRLIEPLGRGGFGEVWKCEAPGGLHKAVKFVPADGDGFRQELAAFEQIKSVRHPFLLALDRVEQTADGLVMVMELADGQLADRARECRADGRAGIPRGELLGYLWEAAEALDFMGERFGLQHLDVKPENIFLSAGHAKVGDYGLVRRAERAGDGRAGGFTPRYTAPEVLLGKVDVRSDQYSLALVYVELLTGRFPFPGQTVRQLMMQHVHTDPDLSGVPAGDRPAVARALAKDPATRFASCGQFVRHLAAADAGGPFRPGVTPLRLPVPAAATAPARPSPSTLVQSLVTVRDRVPPTTVPPPPPPPPADPFADLHPVMFVAALHRPRPRTAGPPARTTDEVVAAVVRAAVRADEGVVELAPPGARAVQFLTTVPAPMAPYKLVSVAERWGLSARQLDPFGVLMQRLAHDPRKPPPARPGGFQLLVRLPAPPAATVTLTAQLFGAPDDEFVRVALKEMPVIQDEIRRQLETVQERRAHPRFDAVLPVRVYPLFPDGEIGRATAGTTRDVSAGGVRFVLPADLQTERAFVEFPGVAEADGLAVYVKALRSWPDADGQGRCVVGRFRPVQGTAVSPTPGAAAAATTR